MLSLSRYREFIKKWFKGDWSESDEGPDASEENPIKEYMDNVMKVVIKKYSEPFHWGEINVKISVWERIIMKFSQLLPF